MKNYTNRFFFQNYSNINYAFEVFLCTSDLLAVKWDNRYHKICTITRTWFWTFLTVVGFRLNRFSHRKVKNFTIFAPKVTTHIQYKVTTHNFLFFFKYDVNMEQQARLWIETVLDKPLDAVSQTQNIFNFNKENCIKDQTKKN